MSKKEKPSDYIRETLSRCLNYNPTTFLIDKIFYIEILHKLIRDPFILRDLLANPPYVWADEISMDDYTKWIDGDPESVIKVLVILMIKERTSYVYILGSSLAMAMKEPNASPTFSYHVTNPRATDYNKVEINGVRKSGLNLRVKFTLRNDDGESWSSTVLLRGSDDDEG